MDTRLPYASQYLNRIQQDLQKVVESQFEPMAKAAAAMTESVLHGGVLHFFGAGHFQLLVEEVWYRAGQLVCIHPIFDQGLWPHNGPRRSSHLEQLEGYGRALMSTQDLRAGETLMVISSSGRNPAPVEVAQAGKQKGLTVVALTSLEYSRSVASWHSSGLRLSEVADIVLDNQAGVGETGIRLGNGMGAGPTTTAINAAILNALLVQVAANLADAGMEPPLFQSSNLDADPTGNLKRMEQYAPRIPVYKG